MVVDLPTVLAISLTVVGWVLMTVVKTVSRDTERMLLGGVSDTEVMVGIPQPWVVGRAVDC